jgi:uncharacterized protein
MASLRYSISSVRNAGRFDLRALSLHAWDAFRNWLVARPRAAQWAVLLGLSALFVPALEALRLPAALLLGPMAAAILLAASDAAVRVPHRAFYAAQAIVGCLIARGLPSSIIGELTRDWFYFIAAIVAVIAASMGLGWLLARRQVLPGTTAIWGMSPGGATAIMLMAEAFGADIRLVAFMQYLRVVLVVLAASVISGIGTAGSGGALPATVWFPPLAWQPFIETMAVAAIGAIAGRLLRIPAGALLVPLAAGVLLQDSGVLTIELPPWLLAVSYALIGWSIGLRFTRAILLHAARAFPRVIVALLTIIVFSGVLAAFLVVTIGVDPLTAYLATSPGGADSVAIIAASTNVDVPFVMAMQALRLAVVILMGPSLLRFLAASVDARNARAQTAAEN